MRIFTFLTLVSLFASCDQTSTQIEEATTLYNTAKANNDKITARIALNELLILEPDNHVHKEALANIYMDQGNYKGGTKLAQELHDANKADDSLQVKLGLAYQQIPDIESSEAIFDGLFKRTNNFQHFYQKVAMAMNNQPIFDSLSNFVLESIKSDSTVANTTIDFPTNNGIKQDVPLEAATYYLIARQAIEMKQDFRKSEEYYIKAITLYDPFYMARKDLSDVYSLAQQQQQARQQGRR